MDASTGLLSIDLDAIAANWRALKERVHPAVTSAVIKAGAYGLGDAAVGAALYRAGCRHFFVATLEEGEAARSYLPADATCYVLGGAPAGAEPRFNAARLAPVLSSLPALERWSEFRRSSDSAPPCAIKFDTGMTRLGLALEDLDNLLERRHFLQQLDPQLVMSHLACADEPDHPQNSAQQRAFAERVPRLRQVLPGAALSLANSSGIFLGRHYHFDLVRPGASLYGFNPTTASNPMQSVVELSVPVIQLRRLSGDAAIGYGATEHCPAGRALAVVAGGYADGLHRLLGRRGEGQLLGEAVPVVGRVSMDTTVFDVSAVPDIDRYMARSGAGLWVTVVNESLNLSVLSQRNRALGYELLTSLRAGRYRRQYLGEGQ